MLSMYSSITESRVSFLVGNSNHQIVQMAFQLNCSLNWILYWFQCKSLLTKKPAIWRNKNMYDWRCLKCVSKTLHVFKKMPAMSFGFDLTWINSGFNLASTWIFLSWLSWHWTWTQSLVTTALLISFPLDIVLTHT